MQDNGEEEHMEWSMQFSLSQAPWPLRCFCHFNRGKGKLVSTQDCGSLPVQICELNRVQPPGLSKMSSGNLVVVGSSY